MTAVASSIVQKRVAELGLSREKMAFTQLRGTDVAFLFYWREWIIFTVDGLDPVYVIDPRGKSGKSVQRLFDKYGQTVTITE